MSAVPPFSSGFRHRVLVVDDNEMVLRTLRRQLEDEGFIVSTAQSSDEALELLNEQRFHTAVIDLRLNDSDDENCEGLELMDRLHTIDPTLSAIMLTGNADVKSVRKAMDQTRTQESAFRLWTSPAFKFLEKTPEDLQALPNWIREGMERVHGANLTLQIEASADFKAAIVRQVGSGLVQTLRGTQIDELHEEVDELLRKLFADWDHLIIEPVTSDYTGYSRAVVFKATPSAQRGEGEVIVAKIGACPLIEREVRGYRNHIKGLAGNFVPTALEPAWRTRNLGGMLYTYAGLGGTIRDFADYFRANDPAIIASLVDTLFRRTLSWQTKTSAQRRKNIDLRALFFRLLRLQPDELVEKRTQLAGSADSMTMEEGALLLDNGSIALPDPVDYVLGTEMTGDYSEISIHGDLHVHNVLVDEQNNAWLIDFANAAAAPLYYDHAFFEMSIRIELVESADPRTLYEWASLLTSTPFEALPEELARDHTIEKAHRAIETIRRRAMSGRAEEARRTQRFYMMMLFFIALRLITVRFMPETRRRHALIAAAVLARRLRAE